MTPCRVACRIVWQCSRQMPRVRGDSLAALATKVSVLSSSLSLACGGVGVGPVGGWPWSVVRGAGVWSQPCRRAERRLAWPRSGAATPYIDSSLATKGRHGGVA
jgi:hypothetical protein